MLISLISNGTPNVATFGGVRSSKKQACWNHKLAEFGSFSIAKFGSFVDSQEMFNFGILVNRKSDRK